MKDHPDDRQPLFVRSFLWYNFHEDAPLSDYHPSLTHWEFPASSDASLQYMIAGSQHQVK